MKIVIGSDHAGFQLKVAMGDLLRSMNQEVLDVGAFNENPSDYPDFAEAVGRAILDRKAERGVLICGSGVGASVAANKLVGIRAAVCHDTYSAHQGVEHDDMNVLVLGSRIIGVKLAEDLVKVFLAAKFTSEDRHVRRLAKIKALESKFVVSSSARYAPEKRPKKRTVRRRRTIRIEVRRRIENDHLSENQRCTS